METPQRYVHGVALLATGLLAGAFAYGAANEIPTFGAVPLDVRLTFQWAAGPVPAGYAEIFRRWELFHDLRTLTTLAAFVLIVAVAVVNRPANR
ncbi:hypothetical protein OHB01_24700 [Microbispora hainanensis]|jgi:hypothetical protein|uniref:DUF1772 domain-containing protein n=1 Tax=Microbispora hainanensis TaxID=568844 RepID=A0ABZ1SW40_9ACTN|nr:MULTISPECIES: hypothetical protein [Microbispora]NJP22982.1 hypothetical protein [Microbispora sp. CL1-1]TQS16993.1 hypothetical protein FLW53_01905 [Microbispora sp. SCL1-1]